MRRASLFTCVLAALSAAFPVARSADLPTEPKNAGHAGLLPKPSALVSPPAQPARGFGGCDYRHASVKESKHGIGGRRFHLFEPAEPAPAAAPVIVFLHGWAAIDPWLYGAWINHLTRRGNIVIHPRYQHSVLTPANEFTPNMVHAVKAALTELATSGHVTPDTSRFAIAGHSVGGLLTANLAALTGDAALPVPRALMCVQPGRSASAKNAIGVPLEDLSRIPSNSLLLCITGECDVVCGDIDAKRILTESTAVPAGRKNLVALTADFHGQPALTGSHLAPCSVPADTFIIPEATGKVENPDVVAILAAAGGDFGPMRAFLNTPHGRQWKRVHVSGTGFAETFDPPNAQDFALWRLFDALCEAAFAGDATVDALAMSPRSLRMGAWSDGTPVKPMRSSPATAR